MHGPINIKIFTECKYFVVVDSQIMFYAQFVGMLIIYLITTLNTARQIKKY